MPLAQNVFASIVQKSWYSITGVQLQEIIKWISRSNLFYLKFQWPTKEFLSDKQICHHKKRRFNFFFQSWSSKVDVLKTHWIIDTNFCFLSDKWKVTSSLSYWLIENYKYKTERAFECYLLYCILVLFIQNLMIK